MNTGNDDDERQQASNQVDEWIKYCGIPLVEHSLLTWQHIQQVCKHYSTEETLQHIVGSTSSNKSASPLRGKVKIHGSEITLLDLLISPDQKSTTSTTTTTTASITNTTSSQTSSAHTSLVAPFSIPSFVRFQNHLSQLIATTSLLLQTIKQHNANDTRISILVDWTAWAEREMHHACNLLRLPSYPRFPVRTLIPKGGYGWFTKPFGNNVVLDIILHQTQLKFYMYRLQPLKSTPTEKTKSNSFGSELVSSVVVTTTSEDACRDYVVESCASATVPLLLLDEVLALLDTEISGVKAGNVNGNAVLKTFY